MITIKEFMKEASREQKELYDKIHLLAIQEQEAFSDYNRRQRTIEEGLERITRDHGLQTVLIQADRELLIDPQLPARSKAAQRVRETREDIASLLKQAVSKGMGSLGIIQRHYESYTNERLPTTVQNF